MTNEKKRKHEKQDSPENERSVLAGEERSESAGTENETVSLPLKEYANHLEEMDDLRQKVDEFSDGWQRERADFANYRKRIDRDQEMQRQNNKIDIIKKYLAVHDDFERALKTIPQDNVQASWMEGLRLIDLKLKGLLEGEGVAPIPADNSAFDPVFHEAISHEEHTNFESGQIIEVVQQGYTIGERVIRPALVRVAK